MQTTKHILPWSPEWLHDLARMVRRCFSLKSFLGGVFGIRWWVWMLGQGTVCLFPLGEFKRVGCFINPISNNREAFGLVYNTAMVKDPVATAFGFAPQYRREHSQYA
jgi:hypothetical protein